MCVSVCEALNVVNPIRAAASGHDIYNSTRDLSQWLSIRKKPQRAFFKHCVYWAELSHLLPKQIVLSYFEVTQDKGKERLILLWFKHCRLKNNAFFSLLKGIKVALKTLFISHHKAETYQQQLHVLPVSVPTVSEVFSFISPDELFNQHSSLPPHPK